MTHYLISMFQPQGEPPPREILDPIMRDIDALNDELRAAGAWVFAGGLHPPDSATTLKPSDDGHVLVDHGPFAEASDHPGGFWIIEASSFDAALSWARKAALATTLPVEVRAFRPR